MNKKSQTVIYFGNERIATGVTSETPALIGLIEAGYHVAAVVTNYKTATSRNSRELEVAKIAKEHNIPLIIPTDMKELAGKIKLLNPEIGILVAFGRIVPQEITELFPSGIINIHPSLLPLHRGPTPIESVILNGEQKTGVSIIQLSKKMDAGPVFAQSEIDLTGKETKQDLADNLLEIGSSMLIDLLPEIIDGQVVAIPQDESRATYDSLISKQDGMIDWNKPAVQIEREIRAYANWPKSTAQIAGKDVIITEADATSLSGPSERIEIVDGKLIAFCSEGALSIERLKPAGKKDMTHTEFLAGNAL